MNGLPEREYAVYLGLDVGKEAHHACALNPEGKRVHDKGLPQAEDRLRALYRDLATRGPVLVVVDQPASIGALPVAVARAEGMDVAYLPGLAMRRIADLHPGNAKTDAKDAYVIAEAARTMPHALRRVDVGDEALADLEVIVGFDDDLAAEVTRVTNRLHGLLTPRSTQRWSVRSVPGWPTPRCWSCCPDSAAQPASAPRDAASCWP